VVAPGFVRRAGTDRLPDIHRYVRAIEYRLDHLAGDVRRDQRRMAEVRPIERELAETVASAPRITDELRQIAWMVEELRVSVFAQPVGVGGQASPKRIRALLATARSS
jgi:ATP-dependent helicase HrpA